MEKTNQQILALIQKDFEAINTKIATIRERKTKEVENLDQIIIQAQEFIASLMYEKHLYYQHELMKLRSKGIVKGPKVKKLKSEFKKVTDEADKYIRNNNIKGWYAKSERCLGRVADYLGDYKKAIGHYKNALKYFKYDPDYHKKKLPRQLEFNAFISASLIMLGEKEKGIELAKKVYKEFDGKEGLRLKKNDYPTWAIWRTGIPIRTANALIEKKMKFDKKEMLDWLSEAYKFIEKPRTSKEWVGKVDFSLRKDEVRVTKKKLLLK